jgi:hypothetical protein
MTLRSLDDAIEWLRSVWNDERPVPYKLHDLRTHSQGELGTPWMTAAFITWVTARSDDKSDIIETVTCPNPAHHDGDWRASVSCGICLGIGTYEVERLRYRYPLWRALRSLERKPANRPGHPAPLVIVAQLATCGWSSLYAHRLSNVETPLAWEVYEALALMAIRDLHQRYAIAPIPARRWTALSESQQNAVIAGEVA